MQRFCLFLVHIWYEPENHRIRKKRISKEEHIYELLNRLLYVKPYSDIEVAQSQYEEEFRAMSFSTVVEFRMDGSVWVNQEQQMQLPDKEEEIRWEELYFTV